MAKKLNAEELIKECKELIKEYIPNDNTVILRYMDFPKFMSLLQNRKLYFTRADKFEDPLEGDVPSVYIDSLLSFYKCDIYKILHDKILKDKYDLDTIKKDILGKFEKYRSETFISCWTENKNETESYALWKIYAKKYGVAIQTTVRKLKEITKSKGAVIYRVKYIDDSIANLHVPRFSNKLTFESENFFVCKKAEYCYENEIRAMFTTEDYYNLEVLIDNVDNFIDKIYISPFAEEWFFDLIKDILVKYELNKIDVVTSKVMLNSKSK